VLAAASAGFRDNTLDEKLKPKYGHTVIAKPVPLSLKEIDLEPHLVTPSAEPQAMLMISGICVLNVMV
jgi:hypothetical protein